MKELPADNMERIRILSLQTRAQDMANQQQKGQFYDNLDLIEPLDIR